MTSPVDLPDYAPIPKSALGPALNDQGYYVGRVERNLYWVTNGVYQAAFLTTPDGVVLFDAPPSIGGNLRRAVDEIAAANGVTNQVTHFVYSHHHADHGSAAFLFDGDVTRIGHEETKRLLLRDEDQARPLPDVTFADRYTLEVGGERVELAWHGPNHTPDNIYIHFPDHDTLMFINVVNAGWVPIYNLNLSEDVIGYMGAPAIALSYPWTRLISGHLGRLATRDDVAVHQQYIADIDASAREALESVDPVPYYVAGGQNFWAGVKGHLDAVTERAAAPVIAKYTAFLLIGGSLGDRFGRRKVYLIGTVWFALASAACGLAPDVVFLIITRVLQGVGAALLVPGSLAILEASFRPADRARAIGAGDVAGRIGLLAARLRAGAAAADHHHARAIGPVRAACRPDRPPSAADCGPPGDRCGPGLAHVCSVRAQLRAVCPVGGGRVRARDRDHGRTAHRHRHELGARGSCGHRVGGQQRPGPVRRPARRRHDHQPGTRASRRRYTRAVPALRPRCASAGG